MTQLQCGGGEAQAPPNPAFRNVFTRTWATGAFQDGQPILLSHEPAHQAQRGRGGTASPPQPCCLMAQSWAKSLWPALCSSAAAGALPLPKGKVMHHAKVGESAPRAAKNCQVH